MSKNVNYTKNIFKQFKSYFNLNQKMTILTEERNKSEDLIKDLEKKINELENQQKMQWKLTLTKVDYSDEIKRLQEKINNLLKEICVIDEEISSVLSIKKKNLAIIIAESMFGITLSKEELDEDEINCVKIVCNDLNLDIQILDEYIILQEKDYLNSNTQKSFYEKPTDIERGEGMKHSFIKKIPQINITRANIQDLQEWVDILYHSLKDTYSGYISSGYIDDNYNIKQLQTNFLQDLSIENSSTELYMLRINGEAVGILKIGKPIKYYSDGNNYYKDDIDDVGEIKSLHIRKDFQSQGIGSQAIAFAENRLRQLGYGESSIWVKMQNTNAINFYSNRGYSKTNYKNPNTKDGAPSLVMEKKLRILAKDSQCEEKTI